MLHARIDEPADDILDITAKVAAAVSDRESFTGRQFVSATWELWLDSWPIDGIIRIPKPPLSSITSIKYIDTNGAEQTWSSSNYTVVAPAGPNAQHGYVVPAYGLSFPSIRAVPNAIKVRFVAGYGLPAAVPDVFKQAIKLTFSEMYAFREEQFAGSVSKNLRAADALCWPFRAFVPENC
jgi:uncharacterized phiE125 gp8 family phage protein